ncbi:hypothetical protein ACFPOU_20830 [Massilia jejuensis]|uniref:Uncharacterized protein n=1 Tax=Massilia jejuensis TaxID=648894 RepID=A0ABW0PNB3_9BURK
MMRSLTWVFAVLLPVSAAAQMAPDSPPVVSLKEGRASTALPGSQGAQLVARKIKERTGSQGDITVEFVRIVRFTEQPRCGRVGYTLYQKSSNTAWGQFGGQLNVCEDGGPPLRLCKGSAVLVPANAQCKDGSWPAETLEVQAAMARAVADGSLTGEQFKAKFGGRPKKGEAKK